MKGKWEKAREDKIEGKKEGFGMCGVVQSSTTYREGS